MQEICVFRFHVQFLAENDMIARKWHYLKKDIHFGHKDIKRENKAEDDELETGIRRKEQH